MSATANNFIGRATSGGRILVVGYGLAQLIGVAASPALTRLYSTDEFGYLTIFMSLIGILGLVASLRYDQAVLAAEDGETAERVLGLSIVVSIISGIVVAAILLVVWLLPVEVLPGGMGHLGIMLLLLPVGVACAGIFHSLMAWVTRQKEFRTAAGTRVFQSAATVFVQLAGGIVFSSYFLLMAGFLVGQIAGIWTLVKTAPRRVMENLNRATLVEVAVQFSRFPRYASFATLLNSAALLLPTVMLGALYGSTIAGWFGLGQRVVGLPMFIIGGATAQVYASRFTETRRAGRPAQRRLMWTTIGRLSPVALAILVGSYFAGPVFSTVFGSEWRTAGEYVSLLGIPFALQILVSPVSITANLMDRQDLQFMLDGVRLLAVIAAIVVSSVLGLEPRDAIVALSVVLSVTYLAYLVLYAVLLRGESWTSR